MKLRIFVFACALAISFCVVPSARSWGCKGHQTVALIAEKHLTPEARRLVEKLLGENPIDPKLRRYCGNATPDLMVDASTWPDDVRNEQHNGPWHYIDIPRGKHKGALEEYCGTVGCVTRAIEEQRAILKDKAADPVKRAEAIRYLIHFVGDIPAVARHQQRRQWRELRAREIPSPRTAAESASSGTRGLFSQPASDLGHRDCRTQHGNFESSPLCGRA